MREIILDTETTGLSPNNGDRLIEIAGVEMVNLYRTGKNFHVYVNPQTKVSEGAFKVHGISDEFLKDKPLFEQVAAEFIEFIGDSKLVIHNAPFDMGFINFQLNAIGLPAIPAAQVFDTLSFARMKFPGAKNSLDALCERFGIDNTHRTVHGALLDAELLSDVYSEMMGAGSKQRNLLFAAGQASTTTEEVEVAVKITKEFREARSFPASAEELALHEKFTAKLKDPLWKKTDAA